MTSSLARGLAVALALLVGSAVGCGWHIAPQAIAGKLSERLQDMAARRGFVLELGAVYVEPTSRVVLDGVVLRDAERPERPPVLRAARVEVQYDVHGATSPKVLLQTITMHSPRVHVHRAKDGTTNLDALLALRAGASGGGSGGGGSGGLRKYVSRHIPQLIVRDGAVALDDDKGAPIITPQGIDARHLRLSGASLTIKNTSPIQEVARFDVRGTTKVSGFDDALQVEGQANWPEKAGWARIELPDDFAVRVGGFRAAVQRVTAHSNGRVQLGGVSIERLPADNSPFSLDVRQISITLTEQAMPLAAVPERLARKLPKQALALLRHVKEVAIESPVIVGKRPMERPKTAAAKSGALLLPRKTGRTDTEGKTSGKKTRDLAKLRAERRKHRRTAKQRAMGKDGPVNTDGQKVREALISVATRASSKLESKLLSLRKAAAAIPVRRIQIRNGRARYKDQRLEEGGQMSDFSAEIDRDDKGIVSVKLRFGVPGARENTENAVSGRVHSKTGDSQVSVRLDHLPIAPYAAIMPTALSLHPGSAVENTAITVRYDASARRIGIDGKGAVSHIDVDIPPLARHRIEDLSLKARGKLDLDLANHKVAIDAGRIDMDRMQVLFDGSITDYRTAPIFDVAARIPTVHCQDAVDSVVSRFAPMLEGMRCSGTMAFRVAFALKTANMHSLKFEFEPTLRNLKIDSLGSHIDFAVLEGAFEHNARQPDGTLYSFVTGPGSERWVPLGAINENLIKVVNTTEDGAFFYHKGFSLRQIRGAMVANLRKGRFVRGASTISQQVTKNLFFVEREKTISRKLQEAVVTWEMEHRLTKQQILELYFNIIEFGPRIYGIKAAANHYFNRSPSQLTLLQTIWLGSIIPGPRRFYHQFVRGSAGETWREYLCWIGRIMHKREKILADQLARLGTCNVVFGGAPDGSEEPEDPGFGLGHEGDPTLGDGAVPRAAGEGNQDGERALRRIRQLNRKRPAPSVSPEDQP